MAENSTLSQQMALRQQCRHPSGEVAEITRAEVEQSVVTRFERMVAAYPDKPAIVDSAGSLTYAELDQASNRIAHAIQQRGGQMGKPVAVLMNSSTEILAATYGATKAGLCYVVLTTETPDERLSFILQDLGHPLLLTDDDNREKARSLVTGNRLLITEDEQQNSSVHPLHLPIEPGSPYHIRYTSGSTGRPKGVMSTHRDFLMSAYNHMRTTQLCRHDRAVGIGNLQAVYASLGGATFFEFNLRRDSWGTIIEELARQAVTVMSVTATAFRQLVRGGAGHITCPDMRVVLLVSESSMPSDIVAARALFSPQCVFINRYGTTESYFATSYYASMDSAENLDNLPAGYPLEDMEVRLWDEAGNPVATGEVGEIILRSRYLKQGYWNRPELTREKFRPDPDGSDRRIYCTGDLGRLDPDGCLHYLGRKDQQVKIRGHRIEIPEVEAELMALDGVKLAAVDARPGPNGDLRLVAYIVPAKEGLSVSALREELSQHLPLTMIPASFVFLNELPLTISQKVDRRALLDPGRERPPLAEPYVAPRTPIESTLAQIWAAVLGLEEVGIRDNFLDLGGNSLLASQIVTRAIDTLRVDVSLAAIFAAPTVEAMALAVTEAMVAEASDETIGRLLAEIAKKPV